MKIDRAKLIVTFLLLSATDVPKNDRKEGGFVFVSFGSGSVAMTVSCEYE
jgi:hypothetical protein